MAKHPMSIVALLLLLYLVAKSAMGIYSVACVYANIKTSDIDATAMKVYNSINLTFVCLINFFALSAAQTAFGNPEAARRALVRNIAHHAINLAWSCNLPQTATFITVVQCVSLFYCEIPDINEIVKASSSRNSPTTI